MGIGAKLWTLMNEKGTNANDLAKRIGVAPTTIYSMIKRDSKKADIEILLKIAKELDVDLKYFSDEQAASDVTTVQMPAYDEMLTIYTRNRQNLSREEKMRLARIILSDDEE